VLSDWLVYLTEHLYIMSRLKILPLNISMVSRLIKQKDNVSFAIRVDKISKYRIRLEKVA